MTEESKPRYELRKQSKSYVCLWEGNHNLCSICTNTKRGGQDAQLIQLAMSCHKELLAALKQSLSEMQAWNDEGCDCPPEGHVCGFLRLRSSIEKAKAAIEQAKNK